MKQPELGQTIVELRQKHNLTQEELVEKCNISVRTLQRIESGDVTPRDYTIKTLLSALDYQVEDVVSAIENKKVKSMLQLGWISGVIFFLTGIAEAWADFSRMELEFYDTSFQMLYMVIKVICATSFVFFMLGFVGVGKIHQNSLLKISAYLMLGSMVIIEFHDTISLMTGVSVEEFMGIKALHGILFGGIDVIFGIALYRLSKNLGNAALFAGLLEIGTGLSFMLVALAPLGLLLWSVAILFEVVVLFKVYDKKNLPTSREGSNHS